MDDSSARAKFKQSGYRVKPGRAAFIQVPIAVVADQEISDGAFRLFCLLCAYARNDESTWWGRRSSPRRFR